MTESSPLISVVIPAYNRADRIGPAIESVQKQTIQDVEIIVVDDGSSDDLAGALARARGGMPLHLIRHERNRGVSAARNTGVREARGCFVAFLDSDDIWREAKLERQLALIEQAGVLDSFLCVTQTEIVMPGGWTRVRPREGVQPGRSLAEFLYLDGGFAQASSFLLPRALAQRIPFSENMKQYEDHLFFIAVGAAGGHYLLVPEPLVVWNNDVRPGRLSEQEDAARVDLFLKEAGDLLSESVSLALKAKALAPLVWRRSRLESLAMLLNARRAGALSTRQMLEVFIRTAAPQTVYEMVRRTLTVNRVDR